MSRLIDEGSCPAGVDGRCALRASMVDGPWPSPPLRYPLALAGRTTRFADHRCAGLDVSRGQRSVWTFSRKRKKWTAQRVDQRIRFKSNNQHILDKVSRPDSNLWTFRPWTLDNWILFRSTYLHLLDMASCRDRNILTMDPSTMDFKITNMKQQTKAASNLLNAVTLQKSPLT